MYTLIIVLIAVVCVLLMFAVLIQNPKGGGLGAGFANIGNQVMGARRTTDFMEKTTWTLVVVLLSLSLLSIMFIPAKVAVSDEDTAGSSIQDRVETNIAPNLAPPPVSTQPAPAPTSGAAPGTDNGTAPAGDNSTDGQ